MKLAANGPIKAVPLPEVTEVASHKADIVIVGAGIIGCALAVAFGNQGRSVIVLERSLKEPDRIVGELLQPGGVRALEKLGLAGTIEQAGLAG
jgi:squalene monooxygenase